MSFKINKYDKSTELFQRAAKVIPSGLYGHQGPAEGCCIPVSAYPLFSQKAKGSYFWDVDGNKFIDYMCAYGPNVLGYNDPDVDAAALAQAKIENCVTAPSTKIIEFAECLVDTVASADWAFFAKNGGDTTTAAIMTARAATHRKKIIFVNGFYHGVAPWCQKVDYPGVLPEDVANNLYVDWNDFEGLKRVVEENEGEIAAFISTPYLHGNFIDNVLPAEGYWQKVRKLCTEKGIVLIEKMKKLDTPKMFRENGLKLTNGLKAAAENNGFHLSVSGEPALFYLMLKDDDSLMLHQEWIAEIVKRGVFMTNHHNHFMNASLTDEDIKQTIDVAEEAFHVLRKNHPELG